MDEMETIKHHGLEIKIYQEEDPESPREWDNLGTMFCMHKRYSLGDTNIINGKGENDFSSWKEIQDYLFDEVGVIIVLPLFLYDHSGLRMKVGSFQGYLSQGHAEFDSGQVGFIYATEEEIVNEYGSANKKNIATAKEVLMGEVETYDAYLSGQVYGYTVDKDGESESCWGFYEYECCKEAAKDVAEGITKRKQEEHEKKLKGQIKSKAPLTARVSA